MVDFEAVDAPVVVGPEPDDEDGYTIICALPAPETSGPSHWFAVGAWSMFVLSAAIAITVVVSALVS